MFHSMEECLKYFFQQKKSSYEGEPIQAVLILLEALGNPHKKVKYIHIAGSNGKGSTLNATREILMEHGYRVGAFVSPHLERVNERITINNVQISDDQFLHYANEIAYHVEKKLNHQFPSFFELMTIMAFLYFSNEQVDIVLMETGIGGRFDCTNVIIPEVSVITTISLEHTEILGNTLQEIAYQKAGIIKEKKPVVVGVKQQEALQVIQKEAKEKNVPCYVLGKDILTFNVRETSPQIFDCQFMGETIEKVPVIMDGIHQVHNAALAISAAKLFDSTIDEKEIRAALKKTKWKGRFERITNQVIIDGAHNSEGTMALIDTLQRTYPNYRYNFIYAALKDKDHQKSIELMDKVANKMCFTEFSNPRVCKASHLFSQSNHKKIRMEENWRKLVDEERKQLQKNELLIITGSLYFIAEVRKYLMKEEKSIHDTKF